MYVCAPGAPGKSLSYLPPVPPISPHCLSPCWGPENGYFGASFALGMWYVSIFTHSRPFSHIFCSFPPHVWCLGPRSRPRAGTYANQPNLQVHQLQDAYSQLVDHIQAGPRDGSMADWMADARVLLSGMGTLLEGMLATHQTTDPEEDAEVLDEVHRMRLAYMKESMAYHALTEARFTELEVFPPSPVLRVCVPVCLRVSSCLPRFPPPASSGGHLSLPAYLGILTRPHPSLPYCPPHGSSPVPSPGVGAQEASEVGR